MPVNDKRWATFSKFSFHKVRIVISIFPVNQPAQLSDTCALWLSLMQSQHTRTFCERVFLQLSTFINPLQPANDGHCYASYDYTDAEFACTFNC